MEFKSHLPSSPFQGIINLHGCNSETKSRTHENENHTQLDFTCLSKIYANQLLSDVVLVAERREISAHKLILALSSTYFYWQFSKDRKQKQLDRIEIGNVSYDTLSAIVSYLYNSKIHISEDNVKDLMAAADFFVLRSLKKACGDFLVDNINPRTCISTGNTAKLCRNLELVQAVDNYIFAHFSEVVNYDEYLELPYDEVKDLISNDLLKTAEENVLDCVINWVKYDLEHRKIFVYDLMKCVRFSVLSKTYIIERLHQEQWFVSDRGYYFFLGRMLESCVLQRNMELASKPRQSKFLVAAGYAAGNTINVEILDLENYIWTKWSEVGDIKLDEVKRVAICGSKIYGITDKKIKCMDLKNPHEPKWSDCTDLLYRRDKPSIVGIKNSVYVIGGAFNPELSASEKFDASTGETKKIANMLENRHSVGLGVLDGMLFAVGGQSASDIDASSVEYFDSASDTWYTLPNMSISRYESGVAALGDALYVVGGLNKQGSCKEVEVYNHVQRSWKRLPDMNFARAPGIIAANNQLFVIGGYNSANKYLRSVEVYNTRSNTWSVLPCSLKKGMYYVSVALIDRCDINLIGNK